MHTAEKILLTKPLRFRGDYHLIMGPMGAALLERRLLKMNPCYAAYPARTSSILPTPPKE